MKTKIDTKLALKENSSILKKDLMDLNPEIVEIARLGVLKFGKISSSYLMRKLKCSRSRAKDLMTSLFDAA